MPDHTPDAGRGEPTMTVPEFAAWCLAYCDRPAQGFDASKPCGWVDEFDGVPTYRFCGHHWGAVL